MKYLLVRHFHHHIDCAFELVLAVGEVDDKEDEDDESNSCPNADLGVLPHPKPERPLLAWLSWRAFRVLQQQGGDVLELGSQVWGE